MVVIAEREINRGGRWPKMSENILIFIVRELIILLNRIAMEISGQKSLISRCRRTVETFPLLRFT